MIAFTTSIMFNNKLVQYEIFELNNKFKAVLLDPEKTPEIPTQLTFWKVSGRWTTHIDVTEYIIYQFGNSIDNTLLFSSLAERKNFAA